MKPPPLNRLRAQEDDRCRDGKDNEGSRERGKKWHERQSDIEGHDHLREQRGGKSPLRSNERRGHECQADDGAKNRQRIDRESQTENGGKRASEKNRDDERPSACCGPLQSWVLADVRQGFLVLQSHK